MTGPQPKPGVLDIPLYIPGKSRASGAGEPVKLSANENALGCSPFARAAYLEAAKALSLYPDMNATALRQAIGVRYGLETEQIVFGAGSDEIFTLACQTYLRPGDNAVQPAFGFAAWAIAAQAAGGVMKNAPEKDFHVDVDAILETVDERTKIVFVANPANPTGTAIPFSEIERLHAGLRSDILLIIDGAYSEFAGEGDYAAELALARSAPNVLVTKTFSKLYGLAALRIGWGYGARNIAEALERVRPPFNTTAPAQAAAVAALGDADFHQRSIGYVITARVGLTSFLEGFGLRVLPSAANFLTVLFERGGGAGADAAEAGLARKGVLVRGLANYGMPAGLRITIGAPADLERFRTVFSTIMRENDAPR